jgi:hypothetical protein
MSVSADSAGYTPHGAALGLKISNIDVPRESVEVRLIVLWDTADF